jgi:hypothetical protein
METLAKFDLFPIICLFLMSLVGAVVLFKFFESTAVVKSKQYQAGGAIAGFIIIFMLLLYAHGKITNNTVINLESEVAKLQGELNETRAELESAQQKLKPDSIDGVITPYRKDAKIVLAVRQTDADMEGKFKFSATCIDPENDDVKLYLISPPTMYKFMRIDSKQSMKNINFPTN